MVLIIIQVETFIARVFQVQVWVSGKIFTKFWIFTYTSEFEISRYQVVDGKFFMFFWHPSIFVVTF